MAIQIDPGISFESGIVIGPGPIIPARTPHTITSVGNAQVSTAQVKFGTGSYTNNSLTAYGYLNVTPYNNLAFGTSDFTMECWYYPTNLTTDATIIGMRPLGINGPYPVLASLIGGGVAYYVNGLYKISSAANVIVTNAWQSVALVRSAGSTKIYVNGTQVGSTWVDATNYGAGSCVIAANDYFQNGSYFLKGYLDEIRISNVARYTSNYTPATQPFSNDPYTMLLVHCDGTNGSTAFADSIAV